MRGWLLDRASRHYREEREPTRLERAYYHVWRHWDRAALTPVRSPGRAWAYRALPRFVSKREYLWVLVPYRAKRGFVRWSNQRYCAAHGHDDILWHLSTDPPVLSTGVRMSAPEPRCPNCSVELTACTGYGSFHERKESGA